MNASLNTSLAPGLIAIAFLLAAGCSKTPVVDKDFASDNQYMRDILRRVLAPESLQSDLKVPVVAENDHLLVNNQSLSILPLAENATRRKGVNYLGARFEVIIEGKPQPQLTFGAVGADDMPFNERDKTVINWYYNFGKPLLGALASTPPDVRYENFSVYAGSTLIRGEPSENFIEIKPPWTVLDRIASMLPDPDGHLHSIVFALWIEDGQVSHGECRIDGQLRTKMCESLKDFGWPRAGSTYLYKQAYVLK